MASASTATFFSLSAPSQWRKLVHSVTLTSRKSKSVKDVESSESAFELSKALSETFPDIYLWKLSRYRGGVLSNPNLGWWRTLRNCRIGCCLKLSGISWEDLTQGKTASKESGRSYLRLRQLPNFHPAQQLVPCRNCPTPCISDDKAIPTAIICPIFNTSQWHTH